MFEFEESHLIYGHFFHYLPTTSLKATQGSFSERSKGFRKLLTYIFKVPVSIQDLLGS